MMTRMMKRLLIVLLLMGVMSPVEAQTNVVTNGNFLDGLNGWTINGENVYSVEGDGIQHLVMDFTDVSFGQSSIRQQIPVKNREVYRIRFHREVILPTSSFTFGMNGITSDGISNWVEYPTGSGTYEIYKQHNGADGVAEIYFAPRDSATVRIALVSVVCVNFCFNPPNTPTSPYPSPTPAPSKTPNPMATPQLTAPSPRPSQEPNCGIYDCGVVSQNYPQMPGLSSPTALSNSVAQNNTPIPLFTTREAGASRTPIIGVDIDTGGAGVGIGTPVSAIGDGGISMDDGGVFLEDDNSDLFFRYVKGVTNVSFGPFSPLVAIMLTFFSFFILLLGLEIAIPLFVIIVSIIRKGLSLLADFIPF